MKSHALTFASGILTATVIGYFLSHESRAQTPPPIAKGQFQGIAVVPKSAGGNTNDTMEVWIVDTTTGRTRICGGGSGICRTTQ
jgi:hypothetical protein